MSKVFLSNCHTHTVYCDGNNTPEEMVKQAVKQGFHSLGFSVHSPMKFENDYAIKLDKLDEYYNCIEKLKNEYKGSIEIYNGIELDCDHDEFDTSRFDYIIVAVHQLHCGDRIYSIDYTADELKRCVEAEFDGSYLAMAKQYYSSLARFVCDIKPDVVAHTDLISKFNHQSKLFDEDNIEYQMITKLYLERICLECPDTIFEVNTGAMFRCKNPAPYPAMFILRFLNENNMKITLSSDTHSTDSLDYGFNEAVNLIKQAGYSEIYLLDNGGFKPHKI
ncbi:MAG: histidinol-phosphatase HisJ family protein [Acutalibacteraceae bacterium]